MTLLSPLFERRTSLEDPSIPISDPRILDILSAGYANDSGVTVNPYTALNSSAVWRCFSLISGLSGSLPLHCYDSATRERKDLPLLANPHPEMTPRELLALVQIHRMGWGNFYAYKLRNNAGQIVQLLPIHPSQVKVYRYPYGAVPASTWPPPSNKAFIVTDDSGKNHVLISRDILHIPGLGYDGICGVSPIRAMRQAVGLGLAAETYGARLFGSGSLFSGVLQTEQRLDDDQAVKLKARWIERMTGLSKSHDIAILDAGAKFQQISMPNSDAQFLESRRFQIVEVGRFFGVPPFLLAETENSTSWGTGLEQQASGFVKFDLHPSWLAPIEARITKELLIDEGITGRYAEYTIDGLQRGDSAARTAYYRGMREIGALSANDVRDKENLPRIPDGDTYLQPLNLAPLGYDPTKGTTP